MDNGMSRFIMLQAMKMFDSYNDKEEITAEDIEMIQKKLSLYENEAKEYKVEFNDEEKQILKEKTTELINKYKKSKKMVIESEIGEEEVINIKFFDKAKDFFKNKLTLIKKSIADKKEQEITEQEEIEIETLTPQNINISSKAKDFFKNKLTKIKKKEIDENSKDKIIDGGVIVAGIACVVTSLALGVTLYNQNKEEENEIITLGEELQATSLNAKNVEQKINDIVIENELEKVVEEQIISENKYFDVNSNTELVKHMSNFIVDCLSKGIAIKDVMTEEEIKEAEKNNVSFLSIEQLMDYYYVINIEDIDPIDYARLNYSAKTTDTILNNYLACANIFTDDLLTAKEDTTIDYSEIISDKESSNAVQTMADYIGKLNSSKNKSEVRNEITNYIEEEYVKKYDDLNSVSANEQIYRFMFSYDELTNGKGIPTDINIILNEDRTYSCSNTKEGYKNKSERAQDYTDIKNIVKDKLEISRNNTNQDLSQIDDREKKTGLELEEEIKENVLNMNPVFNINPEFKPETIVKENNIVKKSTSTQANTATPSPIKGDNGLPIVQSEFDNYGIDSSSPTAKQDYEAAVKEDFEKTAAEKDTHVIKNMDGDVVVRGSEVDTTQYNHGYSDGYYDGNNKLSSSPYSNNTSYLSGYKEGYREGAKAREKLDENQSFKKEEYFENKKDKVVSEKESDITYNDYTDDPHVNENYNSSNNTSISDNVEVKTEFVPLEEPKIVEENIEEPIILESYETEEITYEDYTDSEESRLETNSKQNLINEYNELKQILQSINNVVDDSLNYKTI